MLISTHQVHELTNSSLTRNELLIHNFTAIIVTDKDFSTLVELDLLCKELNIPLCATGVTGVCGYIFNDFHGKFHVHDVDGEESRSVSILILYVNILRYVLMLLFSVGSTNSKYKYYYYQYYY